MKINLILHPDEFTSFRSRYLVDLFGEYFNYLEYDDNVTYDKQNSLFATRPSNNNWTDRFSDQGYKVIIDNLWERPETKNPNEISCENWFWYNEALWNHALGHNTYVPNKTYKKLAFMPIRHLSPARAFLLDTLSHKFDQLIYSCVDRNIFLPGDGDTAHSEWERFFNPEWYDDTFFSIVAETFVDCRDKFITEKTFKPIAFFHPFVIFGQTQTLKKLRNLGFATFDNIFDESYDNEENIDSRLKIILNNVENFEQMPYDALTLEKLQHNHNLFFDFERVKNGIVNEVIMPLLELINE